MYPTYPKACTDDFEYIQENNCTGLWGLFVTVNAVSIWIPFDSLLYRLELLWPKHLIRGDANFTILPYLDQPYYWPGPNGHYGPYWPIRPKDYYSSHGMSAILNESAVVAAGTPLFPYAATGPRQVTNIALWFWNICLMDKIVSLHYCWNIFKFRVRGWYHKLLLWFAFSMPRPFCLTTIHPSTQRYTSTAQVFLGSLQEER